MDRADSALVLSGVHGRACRAVGFEPKIAFAFDDYQALKELVAAGGGIGFVPGTALGRCA